MTIMMVTICPHICPNMGLPWCLLASDSIESACNEGDLGSIPGQENPLEKEMATHSSILAWRIPQTEEPGGLQSMGSQRIGHDWATTTFTFTCPNIQDGLKRVDCFLHHLLFIEHLLCTRHWRLLIVFLNLEITLQDECRSSRQ